MKRVIKRVKKLFYGDVFVDLKPIFLSMRNYTLFNTKHYFIYYLGLKKVQTLRENLKHGFRGLFDRYLMRLSFCMVCERTNLISFRHRSRWLQ